MTHLMTHARRWAFALLGFALLAAAPAARATIRYDVSLARPAQHQFHVTMTIPDVRQSVVVQMPAWSTLYQIRDFAYHVTALHAVDASDNPLTVVRLDGQTWRIQAQGEVRIAYADYWDEPGPFGTQLNSEHAFLNLAMVLCYVPDRRGEESIVSFGDIPQNWRTAVELPAADALSSYRAAGYDALVDAPVEIGPIDMFEFQAAGKPIRVAIHGDNVDHARLTEMLTRIIEYESRLMGGLPFNEYLFIYHVGRDFGGGGMEHANCTTIAVGSASQLPNVSAHEFFHLWNVKRIRPQSLEPVDYTQGNVDALAMVRRRRHQYLCFLRPGALGRLEPGAILLRPDQQINELQSHPARHWQSAEESSLDAWFEKYPMYNDPEFSISYYNKGQLLGLGLDHCDSRRDQQPSQPRRRDAHNESGICAEGTLLCGERRHSRGGRRGCA